MTGGIISDFWRGRRVLVTGHTGFKGAWLTLWLVELGADVVGLSDGVPTSPSLYELSGLEGDVRTITADIRDASAVDAAFAEAAPEVVLHLAAQPLVRRSYAAPAETYAVNVLGTVHVLDAARAVGARSVVVVTSDKCYAPGPHPHAEDDRLGGDDPYSNSKACAEHVVEAYRASFGMPVASGRAGNVIGGGDWGADRLLPDVVAAALGARPVQLRNPAAVRPWQHVLNPLAGYLLLAEALHRDPTAFAEGWNFGPERADELTVREIVDRIGALWGRRIEVATQPGDHPPEAPALRLVSGKARERLGWRPAWDLDAGLAAIVEWVRVYADGGDVRDVTLAQIRRFAEDAGPLTPNAAPGGAA